MENRDNEEFADFDLLEDKGDIKIEVLEDE